MTAHSLREFAQTRPGATLETALALPVVVGISGEILLFVEAPSWLREEQYLLGVGLLTGGLLTLAVLGNGLASVVRALRSDERVTATRRGLFSLVLQGLQTVIAIAVATGTVGLVALAASVTPDPNVGFGGVGILWFILFAFGVCALALVTLVRRGTQYLYCIR